MKRCPKCSASVSSVTDRKGTRRVEEAHSGFRGASSSSGSRVKKSKLSEEARELLAIFRGEVISLPDVARVLKQSRSAVNAQDEEFGWTPVLFAAHLGDAGLIMYLLDHKADVKATCTQGNCALHLACRSNHLEAIDYLMSKSSDIEARNAHGWTPLAWSAIAGCVEAAQLLLEGSAEVDTPDTGGRTPCMWAARHGHESLVRMLLSFSVDLLKQDEAGQTLKEHAEVYEMDWRSRHSSPPSTPSRKQLVHLVEDDAPYLGASHGMPDLRRMSQQYSSKPPPVPFLRPPRSPSSKREANLAGSTPASCEVVFEAYSLGTKLMSMCEEGDWEGVIDIVKKGACIGTSSRPLLRTPLMFAAIHGAPKAALFLAEARCKVDARDIFGWTALHHAVHTGSYEMVSTLYHLGADFGSSTDGGDTVGHLAARADAAAMLQLMKPAMQLNARDSNGLTPLQSAACSGCAAAVRMLLALRADPQDKKEKMQRTVFQLAAAHGHRAVAEAMLDQLLPLRPLWTEASVQSKIKKHELDQSVSWRSSSQTKVRARGGSLKVTKTRSSKSDNPDGNGRTTRSSKSEIPEVGSIKGKTKSKAKASSEHRSSSKLRASTTELVRLQEVAEADEEEEEAAEAEASGAPPASTQAAPTAGEAPQEAEEPAPDASPAAQEAERKASKTSARSSSKASNAEVERKASKSSARSLSKASLAPDEAEGAASTLDELPLGADEDAEDDVSCLSSLRDGCVSSLPSFREGCDFQAPSFREFDDAEDEESVSRSPSRRVSRAQSLPLGRVSRMTSFREYEGSEDGGGVSRVPTIREGRVSRVASFKDGDLSARSRTSDLSELSLGLESTTSELSSATPASPAEASRKRPTLRKASTESAVSTMSKRSGRSTASTSKAFGRTRSRDRKSLSQKEDVPDHPLGLMMVAAKGIVADLQAPQVAMSKAMALGAKDVDGRSALAIAAQMSRPEMVCFLLKMKADLNGRDLVGNTPLMLVAAKGDKMMVQMLMEARALVDLRNNDGQLASDVGANADLRRTLQLEADRVNVEKRMQRYATLQPLAKIGAEGRCRLRLDGLPTKGPVEFLEKLVRDALEDCSIDTHSSVEVVVDHFTHLPRGHAFIDFPEQSQATAAGDHMRGVGFFVTPAVA